MKINPKRLSLMLTLFVFTSLNAQIGYHWVGSVNDDFLQPANWSPVGVPTINDTAYIHPAGPDCFDPVLNGSHYLHFITMKLGSKLVINGDLLIMGRLVIEANGRTNGQLVLENKNSIIIYTIRIDWHFEPGEWNFFSLPFDGSSFYTSIKSNGTFRRPVFGQYTNPLPTDDVYLVTYDGKRRYETNAASTSGGVNWVSVQPDTVSNEYSTRVHHWMSRYKGYLLHTASDTGTLVIRFTPINSNEIENVAYRNSRDDQHSFVNYWDSAAASTNVHANWNFFSTGLFGDFYTDSLYEHPEGGPLIMYYYNPETSTYVAFRNTDALKIKCYTPMFYQASAPELVIRRSAFVSRPQSVPFVSVRREQLGFQVQLSQYTKADVTGIEFAATSHPEYQINEDAVKMMSPRPEIPLLWTVNKGIQMAIHSTPDSLSGVRIGFRAGSAGRYRLSLLPDEDRRHSAMLWLTDHNTGRKCNLTQEDYYFEVAQPLTDEGRFEVCYLPSQITGLAEDPTTLRFIPTRGGMFCAGVSAPVRVCVYSVTGSVVKKLENVTNGEKIDLAPGVYLVATREGMMRKVSIL